VGQALPIPLSVRVADQFNNPVAGVTISWAVISAPGRRTRRRLHPAQAGSLPPTGRWVPGERPTDSGAVGSRLRASDSPVTFTAFSVAGPVSALQTTLVASPAAITASSGTSASTITVTARDQYGNPIPRQDRHPRRDGYGQRAGPARERTRPDPRGRDRELELLRSPRQRSCRPSAGVLINPADTVTVNPGTGDQLAFLWREQSRRRAPPSRRRSVECAPISSTIASRRRAPGSRSASHQILGAAH